eukprot:758092-Hanusia_phi.AAC.6
MASETHVDTILLLAGVPVNSPSNSTPDWKKRENNAEQQKDAPFSTAGDGEIRILYPIPAVQIYSSVTRSHSSEQAPLTDVASIASSVYTRQEQRAAQAVDLAARAHLPPENTVAQAGASHQHSRGEGPVELQRKSKEETAGPQLRSVAQGMTLDMLVDLKENAARTAAGEAEVREDAPPDSVSTREDSQKRQGKGSGGEGTERRGDRGAVWSEGVARGGDT